MYWHVSFDEQRGAAVVTTEGTFTVEDHGRMVADIVSRPEWRPGLPVLFDHRRLEFGDAGYREMISARENHLAHDRRIGRSRSAILMRSVSDYGLGRQFELLVEGFVAAAMAVFIDEDAAWHWLVAQPVVR